MATSSPVVLFTDSYFQRHETGRHPETPRRLARIVDHLEREGRIEACQRGLYTPASIEEIARVHDAGVVARARAVCETGGGMLDGDTVACPESFDVARAAAGACVAAVDAVLAQKDMRALCLIRPPGHHATPHESMGFCLFNNIAIAARHAQVGHGLGKILIIDWDVHHGNGTQDIFFDDGSVAFVSIHRYGHGFYPGTGAKSETGAGRGLGGIRNVPMDYGASRREYMAAFEAAVGDMADRVKPELLLVSAGFDAHAADPIGSLGLEVDDFATMTRFLRGVAATHCHGRLVSCLEGGYNLDVLPLCVRAHLDELIS